VQRYFFHDREISSKDSSWEVSLQQAHALQSRLYCLCKRHSQKVALYVTKLNQSYFLKRMPLSGPLHAPQCAHYEPPPEVSGLGQVLGSAIQIAPNLGITSLRLDFSLQQKPPRRISSSVSNTHATIKVESNKLSMRGLLHYLFDEAKLTHWHPEKHNQRTWFSVRRALLGAALDKNTKNHALTEFLYIPETFFLQHEHEIANRQIKALVRLSVNDSNRMLLIGEIKFIEATRAGYKLTMKHMPQMPLMVSAELHKKMMKKFEPQFSLWENIKTSHLILMATFSVSSQGIHSLESACVMNVNACWIPFETMHEFQLLEALHENGRLFYKCLRYNLDKSAPMAAVVLQDTGESATAVHIVNANNDVSAKRVDANSSSDASMHQCYWLAHKEPMPNFSLDRIHDSDFIDQVT
jgi:hypothetical protein